MKFRIAAVALAAFALLTAAGVVVVGTFAKAQSGGSSDGEAESSDGVKKDAPTEKSEPGGDVDRRSPTLSPSTKPTRKPGPGERYLSADEWKKYALGKTLYYGNSNGVTGREYYFPNSNRVIFIYYDGRCFDGTWTEENKVFCFDYGGLHCFHHVERGGAIIAREADGDEQTVLRRTNEVLSCKPQVYSSTGGAGAKGG